MAFKRLIKLTALVHLALFGVLMGCGGGEEKAAAPAPATTAAKKSPAYSGNAGVEAGAGLRPGRPGKPESQIKQMAQKVNVSARANPFMLMQEEVGYEAEQKAYRFFDQIGGFTSLVGAPPPAEDQEDQLVYEAQPYRRLSGVLVGDSVYAIVETSGGRGDIVRPGQKLTGTDWVVVSIDEEKATLRRDGNKLPKEIIVRLESPPANVLRNNQNNQNPNAGNQAPGARALPPGVPQIPGLRRQGYGPGRNNN